MGEAIGGRADASFPTTDGEFARMFPDAEGCARFLERLRWPEGFVCPGCGWTGEPWRPARGGLKCGSCRRHTSVPAGTLLARTRSSLRHWLVAAWHATAPEGSVSAATLANALGVRYRRAWKMLHRLRVAMHLVESEDQISGRVTVGCFPLYALSGDGQVGAGPEPAMAGLAVGIRPDGRRGRIRLRHLPKASVGQVVGFVEQAVEDGAVLLCGWPAAATALARRGYAMAGPIPSTAQRAPASAVLPVIRTGRACQGWLASTFGAAIDPGHVQGYLAEFTFRWNQPVTSGRARGRAFCRLLSEAMTAGPVTDAELTGGDHWQKTLGAQQVQPTDHT